MVLNSLLIALAVGSIVRGREDREELFETQIVAADYDATMDDVWGWDSDVWGESTDERAEVDDEHHASVTPGGTVRAEAQWPQVEADLEQALVETGAATGQFKWRLDKWDSHLQSKGKKIGRGSFGAVIQGTLDCDRRNTNVQQVAVKVLNTKEGDVKSEVRAMKAFTSANFVRLFSHGHGPVRNGYAIMMEKCDSDLTNHFGRNFKGYGDTASVEEALRVTVDILAGLHELHSHGSGLVHRDLKPDNILVKCHGGRETCHAKIADLGLICAKDRRQATADGMAVCSCGSGGCSGTPIYMAPETVQTRGKYQDAETDNFAVGLMLYELVFAFRPPTIEAARTIPDLFRAILAFSFTGHGRADGWDKAPRHWREYFGTSDGAAFQQLFLDLLSQNKRSRTNTADLLSRAQTLHAAAARMYGVNVAPSVQAFVHECVCRTTRFGAVACREPDDEAPTPVQRPRLSADGSAVLRERDEPRPHQVPRRRPSAPEAPAEHNDLAPVVQGRDVPVGERSLAVSAPDELEGDDFITIKQVIYTNGMQVAAVFDAAKHQAKVDNHGSNEANILDCRTQNSQEANDTRRKRKWLPKQLGSGCWQILAIQGNEIIPMTNAPWYKKMEAIKKGVYGENVNVQIRQVPCQNTPAELKKCEATAEANKRKLGARKPGRGRY